MRKANAFTPVPSLHAIKAQLEVIAAALARIETGTVKTNTGRRKYTRRAPFAVRRTYRRIKRKQIFRGELRRALKNLSIGDRIDVASVTEGLKDDAIRSRLHSIAQEAQNERGGTYRLTIDGHEVVRVG